MAIHHIGQGSQSDSQTIRHFRLGEKLPVHADKMITKILRKEKKKP